jgi:predicted phosphodiesterase
VDRARVAEHPRPDHVIAHISDTHLTAGDGDLYGDVDAEARLSELLERLEASQTRPDALIFTGDLADTGQPDAYRRLRGLVEPLANRLGAEVIWVTGNHDDRAALREHLLHEAPTIAPMDRVHQIAGLRVIALDTSVPGHHHGEIAPDQLQWLSAPSLPCTIHRFPACKTSPSWWSCAIRHHLPRCCAAPMYAASWPGTCTTPRRQPSPEFQFRWPRPVAIPKTS